MRLMPRDLEILKTIAEYRLIRQDQLQALFFGSRSTAQYRLSHLYQHGFVARHFLPVYSGWSPTLYTLDRRGAAALKAEFPNESVAVWKPDQRHEFLAHTLAINDVRIAITLACRQAHYTLIRWDTERDLKIGYDRVKIQDKRGKTLTVSLIPDGYFILETPQGRASCFLEMDRGTMSVERFQTKIRAYQAYVSSGRYQARYQSKSLRVLTVTTSTVRSQHLCAAAEAIGGGVLAMFRFTTQDLISPEAVLHAPIWHVPGSLSPVALVPRT